MAHLDPAWLSLAKLLDDVALPLAVEYSGSGAWVQDGDGSVVVVDPDPDHGAHSPHCELIAQCINALPVLLAENRDMKERLIGAHNRL